ncbi:lipopolysaccharide/colanic/teichoic acid biosynthesis glycosyltransferase [Olsenella profusa DSM 13989]|uniref:sugar transferase n=1 Tax=Olsenella profusa TaxID=138595 RepID=UPI00278334D0|nr:sugar transferase [Olsenella profusa]MDP9858729.1 lipopolysaccharide/colanic/teichoic acid biosynthesis glycosyltransferase [Olsenella profusa DSM 13989]
MEQALGIIPPSGERSGRASRGALYRFAKRVFDIVFSAVAIVLGSWLYVLIVLAIKIDDPSGPVLFKQLRVGKDGRTFRMWKFRSMRVGAEAEAATLMQYNEKDGPVFKMHDDPRVTRVGRFLRAHSLDELPQFFNVLMGQMSVVGPRPGLPSECSSYNYYQAYRLSCKPGITSYWQVQPDRDTISFDEWMRLDVLYLRTRSFLTDLRIIFQTVFAVLRAQGC